MPKPYRTPAIVLVALFAGFGVAIVPSASARGQDPHTTAKSYWLLSSTGQVFAYGKARNYGSEYRKKYKGTITAIKGTPNGKGYWIVTTKAHYGFGDASHYKYVNGGTRRYTGKIKPKGLRGRIVGIATAKLATTSQTITTKTSTAPTKTTTTTSTTTTASPDCSTVAINLNPSTHIVTQQGVAFSKALPATGPTGTWTWTVSPGTTPNSTNLSTLPAGLNLASDGVVSGTPTTTNNDGWVTFTATDSACPSDPISVQQFFYVGEPDISITTSSLSSAQAGVAYSQTMAATGGDGIYDWSATGLPSGLTLSTSGVLSGTPATSDASGGPTQYSVAIMAADSDSEVPSVSQDYTLTVSPAPLTFVTTTLTAVEGQSFTGSIVVGGGVGPYQLSLATGSGMPAGLSFNDGTITGTPTAGPGSYTFTVDAADSQTDPYETSETFDMEVAPTGVAPNTTVTTTNSSSANDWSGYVEQGSSDFTSVGGSFVVASTPALSGDLASAWAGIDGYGNDSIVQAGVSGTGTSHGTVAYEAWWETYPSAVQNIFAVSPGDTINVNIWQISSGEWEITLNDVTNGQGFAVQEPYSGPGATAEWVMEGSDGNPTPFYNGTLTFTNLRASAAGIGAVDMIMDDVYGVSTPSTLGGVGFSLASSTTAPPTP